MNALSAVSSGPSKPQGLGVRLSVGEFVELSTMSNLKNQVDAIRIDQTFVAGSARRGQPRVVQAMVRWPTTWPDRDGQRIETEEQLKFLRDVTCDRGQATSSSARFRRGYRRHPRL